MIAFDSTFRYTDINWDRDYSCLILFKMERSLAMGRKAVVVAALALACSGLLPACASYVRSESVTHDAAYFVVDTKTVVADGFTFYVDTLSSGTYEATGIRVDPSLPGEAMQGPDFQAALEKVAALEKQGQAPMAANAGDDQDYSKTDSDSAGDDKKVYAHHWGYFEKPQFEWRFKVVNQGQVYCTGLSSTPDDLRLYESLEWNITGGVGSISWPPALSFSSSTTFGSWDYGSVTGYYLFTGPQNAFAAEPGILATRVKATVANRGYMRLANAGFMAGVTSSHTYVFP